MTNHTPSQHALNAPTRTDNAAVLVALL